MAGGARNQFRNGPGGRQPARRPCASSRTANLRCTSGFSPSATGTASPPPASSPPGALQATWTAASRSAPPCGPSSPLQNLPRLARLGAWYTALQLCDPPCFRCGACVFFEEAFVEQHSYLTTPSDDEKFERIATENARLLQDHLDSCMRDSALFGQPEILDRLPPSHYYWTRRDVNARWFSHPCHGPSLPTEAAAVLARQLVAEARDLVRKYGESGRGLLTITAAPSDTDVVNEIPVPGRRIDTEFGPVFYWTWGELNSLRCGHALVFHTCTFPKR